MKRFLHFIGNVSVMILALIKGSFTFFVVFFLSSFGHDLLVLYLLMKDWQIKPIGPLEKWTFSPKTIAIASKLRFTNCATNWEPKNIIPLFTKLIAPHTAYACACSNFCQADENSSRFHAIQFISHPDRYLRKPKSSLLKLLCYLQNTDDIRFGQTASILSK